MLEATVSKIARTIAKTIAGNIKRSAVALGAALVLISAPVAAQQIETIDPDLTVDADLAGSGSAVAPPAYSSPDYAVPDSGGEVTGRYDRPVLDLPPEEAAAEAAPAAQAGVAQTGTYGQDDLIGAAEGLFGQGAEGIARLIENILKEQGEPDGYIVGREGGGAFFLGVRYGSGTLHHKFEGDMPVYWTGPSIGFDAGANAGNTFVLVYNLPDTNELFHRFPAGEGQAYLVGGFNASYVRRGDTVLIPIRVGAGLRLGVNAGYLKFSREQRWLPF